MSYRGGSRGGGLGKDRSQEWVRIEVGSKELTKVRRILECHLGRIMEGFDMRRRMVSNPESPV